MRDAITTAAAAGARWVLLTAALLSPLCAQTNTVYGGGRTNWPAQWTAYHSLNDPADGVTARFDIVGDASNAAAFYAVDPDFFYFRIRVDDGSPGTNLWGGSVILLIDQQNLGAGDGPDYAFAWDYKSSDQQNHGMELMVPGVNGSSWQTTNLDDIDGNAAKKIAPPDFGLTNGNAHARIIENQATTNFGTTTLIDFAVSWTHLTNQTSLRPEQSWRFQAGTVLNANDHAWIDTDVAASSTPSSSPRAWGGYVYISTVPEPPVEVLGGAGAFLVLLEAVNRRNRLRKPGETKNTKCSDGALFRGTQGESDGGRSRCRKASENF